MAQAMVEQSQKPLQQLEAFKEKWMSILSKQVARTVSCESELVIQPLQSSSDENPAELSVTAQYIIDENVAKLKQILCDMLTEHRLIHSAVSKCGKDLDRQFQTDLRRLSKNEKNIEANPEYLQKANRLVFEHLMSLGRIEVAETFRKESELSFEIPPKYDFDRVRAVMEPFRNHDFLPAIQWVKEKAPQEDELLFRLHRQHIIQLLINDKRIDALMYARELQPFAKQFSSELAVLMTAVVSYPNVERYQHLFLNEAWLALEEDLAALLAEFSSPLSKILNTGAKTVPMLLTLRSIMNKRQDHFLLNDELPIEVPVQRVHSSFTCPILKTQSTDGNPPMRLACGHVISRDALNKLVQNTRNTRLKCPYCPEESVLGEAKRVYF